MPKTSLKLWICRWNWKCTDCEEGYEFGWNDECVLVQVGEGDNVPNTGGSTPKVNGSQNGFLAV